MSEKSFSQLVVIGSSAGGIDALSKLVSTLPEDFPAPIVLAQHLDPERESSLNEILTRRSTLPVRTVADKEPLDAGVVFVVPANRHVSITNSEIGLQVDSAGRPKPSVDLLMSTAAEVYRENLIAVVLTGTGSDGTNGARLVSEAGGTVVIQDPRTAEFGGMPGSLALNTVDIVADIGDTGQILRDLISRLEAPEEEFQKLFDRERAAHAAAKAARREMTDILESITDAFFAFDGGWCYMYVNQAASEVIRDTGRDPERILGKVLWEEYPELRGTELETELRRAAREGETVEFDWRDPLAETWFRARAYPSGDGVSLNLRDVTERRGAEEALRESEERWRALIDKGADVITVSDRDGTVRFASPSIETVCGYTVEEFVGTNPMKAGHIHPEDLERCGETLRELVDNPGHSIDLQHRYRHGSGEWRWLEGTFTSLFHDPAIGGLVANYRDVTERKEAEEALRENEGWLSLAQQAARSGTWEWNLRSDEIRWSAEHRDLFGFGPSDEPVEREEWWDAIHPDDLPRIEEAGRRCFEDGAEWPEIEYRISHPHDGERWIDARGHTVRDEGGCPVRILGVSVDVTERKKAGEERERLLVQEWRARAATEERKRISRELHDRVAHSIGVVHQSLELYEAFKERTPSQAEAKIKLARETTREALDLTRNISRELHDTEAKDGLSAALSNLLKTTVPPGLETNISVEGDEALVPPRVREQMFLILREAVRNAVSHSGAGQLSIEVRVSPETVVGRVQDDGRGLGGRSEGDDDESDTGLQSMKERAELVGGVLTMSSAPGAGTRIEASVPLLRTYQLGGTGNSGGRG